MATLSQKIKLFQSLLAGDISRTGPIFITLDITRRCNLRCVGCAFHSQHISSSSRRNPEMQDMSPELVKQVCDELKTMNTQDIIIRGSGEPFINPEILEIISIIKTAGFRLTIVTNGTLLNQDIIQALINARVDALRVSLWASSTEQYQQNYPGTNPDNFRKIVENLSLITQLKRAQNIQVPVLTLYHAINRYNMHSINALVDLASDTGCNRIDFSPFYSVGNNLASFVLSRAEEELVCRDLKKTRKRLKFLSIEHTIDRVLLQFEIGEAVWEKMPCYIGWLHAQIRGDGTVLPCCQCDLRLGDLHNSTFQDIWNSTNSRSFRRQTATLQGLASIGEYCNCRFCAFIDDNQRVHRIIKWFSPFLKNYKQKIGKVPGSLLV